MNEDTLSWGAEAKVYIKFDGGLKELSAIISKGLMLPEFTMDNDMYPPYSNFAFCEALGCEIDISPSDKLTNNKLTSPPEGFRFQITISTENCHEEIMKGRMHDLSLWLSKFISTICHLETKTAS